MSSPNISETIDIIERHIGHIPYNYIWELTLQLFSHNSKHEHIFASLYNALSFQYVRSSMKLKLSYEGTTQELVAKARAINEQFGFRLKSLLERPEFIEAIKRKMLCGDNEGSIDLDKDTNFNKPQEMMMQAPRSKTQFNLQVIKETPKSDNPSISRSQYDNKTFQKCQNLVKNQTCFCDSQRILSGNDEQTFKCFHCNCLFHATCMKKKMKGVTVESCVYCFLERMAPLRKVVKPLFVGLMRKHFKKHQITFFVPELQQQQKIQVRCVRLKDGAQTACLFPDVTSITLNQQKCCQFELVNKQSSLKYRKDEPFYLKKQFYPSQDNMMVVSENLESNREKDVRNEAENHVLGIYIVEEIPIEKLISQIVGENTLGFSQSANMLQKGFGMGKAEDEISCQLIKIPLNCPLTSVKIQIPVRGVFCNHFQCFDLKNYLTLISESVNPRWKCPLCKVLAYQLEVDCINQSIIKLHANQANVNEILFFKNGDFAPFIDNQPISTRKNIKELNLPERINTKKRQSPPIIQQPPKKFKFVLPQNAEIIDLD